MELVSHEGIVLEAYKDSKGIWTWGIGVTSASGHKVERYIDNPQPISKVIDIFEWLLKTKYIPSVEEAFTRCLTEAQFAAAVSFHYNTGAIKTASWVKDFNTGNINQAAIDFMKWRNPPEILSRRTKERNLFFNGIWSNTGKATVFTRVKKPSYTPDWSSAKQVDISHEIGN
jgi:GH24 family phage-related lysozyme (muramidase)